MGLTQAKLDNPPGKLHTSKAKRKKIDPKSLEPLVTEEDTIILQKTWTQIKHEVENIGLVAFIK